MVLFGSSNQQDQSIINAEDKPIVDFIALLNSFISIMGSNVAFQSKSFEKKEFQIEEKKIDLTSGERDLRRRLDIVHDVLKKGSQKLIMVDREWQEVLDAVVYILDEVVEAEGPLESHNGKSGTKKLNQNPTTPLELAISDF